MRLKKLVDLIRADVRRPWDLWTTASVVGSLVLLAVAELCSYWLSFPGTRFPVGACLSSLFLLLGFFVAGMVSLLRHGAPRVIPGVLLAVVFSLGFGEIGLALVWLPLLLISFVYRLLGAR